MADLGIVKINNRALMNLKVSSDNEEPKSKLFENKNPSRLIRQYAEIS